MNVEQLETPRKGQRYEESLPTLPSCLKSNEKSPYSHKQSPSQVRFSLPQGTGSESSSEVEKSPVKRSPTKIVFPTSFDNGMTHFMDIQHKVMIDVPENIWSFHNDHSRKERLSVHSTKPYTTESQNGQATHRRTHSLQSVIVDTIQSYNNNKTPQKSNPTDLDMSPLRLTPNDNSELYLRSDSPLNKFKVPVPLEISLPPYLSPENKAKRRNSIIYDGEGYSNFLGDDNSYDEQEKVSFEDSMEKPENNTSDISILSASHEFSFEDTQDVDKLLGIDEDANVNLKSQARNLKKKLPVPCTNYEQRSPNLIPNKLNSRTGIKNSSLEGSNVPENESLKILLTPSKTIHIPDFEKQPTPVKPNALKGFFAMLDSSPSENTPLSPNSVRDELDQNYKFPSVTSRIEPGPAKSSPQKDYLKIADSTHDASFENRRRVLQSNPAGSANSNRHMHRRSRSIHNTQELFNSDTVPYPPLTVGSDIPERSPLRPSGTPLKSEVRSTGGGHKLSSTPLEFNSLPVVGIEKPHNAQNAISAQNDDFVAASNFKFGKTGSKDTYEANWQKESRGPAINAPNDDLSVTSGFKFGATSNKETDITSKQNAFEELDKVVSPMSASKTENNSWRTELSSRHSRLSQTSLARDFFSQDLNEQEASISSTDSDLMLRPDIEQQEDGTSDNSIEIIGEKKCEIISPLSTYHSFRTPLNLPSSVEPSIKLNLRERSLNRLVPSRQLSNNNSHSSYESDFSGRSHQTNLTSCSAGTGINVQDSMKVGKQLNLEYSTHEVPQKKSSISDYSFVPNSVPAVQLSSIKIASTFTGTKDTNRIVREKIGGRMVDVIVLDEEKEALQFSKRRPVSFHEEALENYQEILDLCDKTAERARNIIIDLVKTDPQGNKMNKELLRPSPPKISQGPKGRERTAVGSSTAGLEKKWSEHETSSKGHTKSLHIQNQQNYEG